MRSRRVRWAVLPIAAVSAVAAGPALAEVKTYDSRAKISVAVPLYHGKVKAPTRRCMRGRKVVLFERDEGKVGNDRTNRRGRWVVRVPTADLEPQDRFYAKARRKLNIVSGEGYECKSDRSRTVTFVGD